MKLLLLALCGCILGVGLVIASPLQNQHRLLGNNHCTWGPTFWCSNITNAKSCNAVKHCIQTVWEKHTVPEDTDSICKICLDMVQQARDQLESNETQEDLRAVFEGSCNLIPLKPIKKECCKLADDFIPELVEALASQMNPQAVCSVAGLCNNAIIDKMLAELPPQLPPPPPPQTSIAKHNKPLSCTQCNRIGSIISDKFHKEDRDDVLEHMLIMCGQLSSFSDACSNIILTYFNEIYNHMTKTISADTICHMSGVCSAKYHQHDDDIDNDEIEVRPMSNIGFVEVKDDDIPCELCEQLVRHLRDVLITNTTELEFKTVLEGLCNQTKGFRDECISIADQYVDVIYAALVENLNENEACHAIGICPRKLGDNKSSSKTVQIMPLVPLQTAQHLDVSIKEKPKRIVLGLDEPKLTAKQINDAQLPIDTILGSPNSYLLVDGGQWCTICEYFLHFIQETLASPKNEEQIQRVVRESCVKLPQSFQSQCKALVNNYGDAVIALLIQDIDPSQVCPRLQICPKPPSDVEVFAPDTMNVQIVTKNSGSDKCPLCLLAVQAAKDVLQSDKSRAKIIATLDGLCTHLPQKLQFECTDFVETYTAELVRMLATDFTTQEICANLRLCNETDPMTIDNYQPINFNDIAIGGDIMTNEIPDNTINGQVVKKDDNDDVSGPNCLICQSLVKEAEKRIKNKSSEDQIRQALDHACDKLKKYKEKCEAYVDKHEDQIIEMILARLSPKDICRKLQFCVAIQYDDLQTDEAVIVNVVAIPAEVQWQFIRPTPNDFNVATKTTAIDVSDTPNCVLCEFIMKQLEIELKNKKTDEEIKSAVKRICKIMPKTINAQCSKFVDQYAELIIQLLATAPPKELCSNMMLCAMKPNESKTEIIECAVCHAASEKLATIYEDNDNSLIVSHVIDKTCNMLPAKYNEQCLKMMKIYGQSLVNLISRNELSTACSQIGMCYKDEYVSFVRIDGEK